MKIGAHVSAAGGVQNAPKNAAKLGLECFQFFSRPPQGGPAPELTDEIVADFKETCDRHGFDDRYIHTPFILNLAHKDKTVRRRTAGIIRTDLERATTLACPAIMTHLGSASGIGDENKGQEFAIEGVKEILDGYEGSARLLLEISAGAGMVIGDTFEEMSSILKGVNDDRVGICFDTAHAFASGYDLRTKEAVTDTMRKFDAIIGLEKLELSHANDSKVELSSRKDRHEHIGEGLIGLEGFRAIMSHHKFRKINFILETPSDDDYANDIDLLKKMRDDITRS
ncbi:MAG: deoxyribonuclease IV [Patescibacteria group bacterium]|nr:deoxyribonuclease IV [Patescibacteria group bacterium]